MENELQKENQLLIEQIKSLQAQLNNRESQRNEYSRVNDQSSFFTTFKQSTPRGNISRDQSKRDLQDLTVQVKKLNEEKEQLRKTLKHQIDAYDQKILQKELELSQKEKMYRQLQNDYKELQQTLIQEQSKPAPQPAAPTPVPTKPVGDQIQQYRVQKIGLMNLPCLIIIRRNIFEQFVIEIENTKDRVSINVQDITDLVPDRTKEDHFQLTYKQSNQKITEVYQSSEFKQILRAIKYLHSQQQQTRKQETQPAQQEQQSGLIKSLSSFFMKK
ncbi:unnamed protein product (macronuclear) [Paramecium tetraurelia]|uniref:Uncharacterized protein n=1 Tax=Paramecium tetraurelia TaxID=5888 RepID=A0DAI7_PARTE|nr:uncharacterized protein GSPATT00014961001 [Paramecium tetraurelia]CAK80054.1 unnamed protein product [Paramecium tetraurelia]|eukprot:XP_001447451.1 hypothetical protein (macronuclear) [Paramecium tetraurelia strain d4-2]